jgi:hypothetical protein
VSRTFSFNAVPVAFATGKDRNSYYHRLFIRDREDLARLIPRLKVKGSSFRRPHDVADDHRFYQNLESATDDNTQQFAIPNIDSKRPAEVHVVVDQHSLHNKISMTLVRNKYQPLNDKSIYQFDTVEESAKSVAKILQLYQQQQQRRRRLRSLSPSSVQNEAASFNHPCIHDRVDTLSNSNHLDICHQRQVLHNFGSNPNSSVPNVDATNDYIVSALKEREDATATRQIELNSNVCNIYLSNSTHSALNPQWIRDNPTIYYRVNASTIDHRLDNIHLGNMPDPRLRLSSLDNTIRHREEARVSSLERQVDCFPIIRDPCQHVNTAPLSTQEMIRMSSMMPFEHQSPHQATLRYNHHPFGRNYH